MKKLILSILFIICLSFQASAWNPMVVVSGGGEEATPSACTSCTPGDPADIFCEDFEGSTDPPNDCAWCTWTETVSAGNVLTTGSHTGTWQSCTSDDLGSNALKITVDGANGENAYLWRNIQDDAFNNMFVQFYFWFDEDNTDTLEDSDKISVMAVTSSADSVILWSVQVYSFSNNNILYFTYAHTGGTETVTLDGSIDDGTVYEIKVWYKRNQADGVLVYLDDVDKTDTNNNTTWDYEPHNLYIGSSDVTTNFTSGDKAMMEIDMIEFDGDTLPTSCEE